MAEAPLLVEGAPAPRRWSWGTSALGRVLKYTAARAALLSFTVIVGVYLTILIANMGGAVDNIRRGQIREGIAMEMSMSPDLRKIPVEERNRLIEERTRLEEKRYGLDQPFVVRSVRFLENALTLNLGKAEHLTSDSGSREVRLIILERLPPTLVLFASANLFLFFLSISMALFLSRRYGSLLDRIVIAMSPISAAPAWFYGLFLILFFAAIWGVLPYGGMVDAPVPEQPLAYGLSVLRHMVLPVAAMVISSVFASVYSWRTFFLIYSSEDYVEMAKAKGLSSRDIERQYILRPTLPTIVTNFALMLISLWTGAIIL
ncbi:MAG: ABC transporter permease, partial [Chloroflexi bacterium]|nr:ABC transporter permease [Chloroflexota bacterium]